MIQVFSRYIDLAVLSRLHDCAAQHVEDIETGIDDGTYRAEENTDLPLKRQAVDRLQEFFEEIGFSPRKAGIACKDSSAELPERVDEQLAFAGELLIRAAAVLGSLSEREQLLVRQASGGAVSAGIAQSLYALSALSNSVQESLETHPPKGFSA